MSPGSDSRPRVSQRCEADGDTFGGLLDGDAVCVHAGSVSREGIGVPTSRVLPQLANAGHAGS